MRKCDRTMKTLFKTAKGIVCLILMVLLVLSGLGIGGYELWRYQQPKFQDVTVELGTDTVSISQFMTQYARPKRVSFVSDVSIVNLNDVGETELTLRHGKKDETVILRVQDTTPPTADFITSLHLPATEFPKPEDLVENVQDLSDTTVSFVEEPYLPEDYRDLIVTVVVTDASGNSIQQDCAISFQWMHETFTLELGQTLTKADLLLNPEKDEDLIEQKDLDAINESDIGEYTLLSASKAKTTTCVITVQDTRGPELVLQEASVFLGKTIKLEDFIVSATDPSGEVTLRLMTELDCNTEGSQTVVIEAEDKHGNITRQETTLLVTTDNVPPVISGLSAMKVEKNGKPNYLAGVTATDAVDGACTVTYNADKVNLSKAGVYYITYYAKDKSGNVATARRKIEVTHNAEDTRNLVKSIAEGLGNDPEALRNYVRSKIGYSSSWGGDDPVWYGFTNWTGNCYVHALCLKSLYDYKGIENQLIWVTDKSHYWLIIKIDGKWKHIDPTPSNLHSRYSLMNDAQRYETLSGRNWDRTKWPACE